MSKKKRKTAKRKKKTGKRKATRKSRKRAYKGSPLHKYNMKRAKQARKGRKSRTGRKAKSKAYAARKRGANSILGYKEHSRLAAEKKAVREKLTAQGKPKAVVDKIMNRLYRMRGPKKTKSRGWAAAYAAQQAAERAEAYARQNYARHVSYS